MKDEEIAESKTVFIVGNICCSTDDHSAYLELLRELYKNWDGNAFIFTGDIIDHRTGLLPGDPERKGIL